MIPIYSRDCPRSQQTCRLRWVTNRRCPIPRFSNLPQQRSLPTHSHAKRHRLYRLSLQCYHEPSLSLNNKLNEVRRNRKTIQRYLRGEDLKRCNHHCLPTSLLSLWKRTPLLPRNPPYRLSRYPSQVDVHQTFRLRLPVRITSIPSVVISIRSRSFGVRLNAARPRPLSPRIPYGGRNPRHLQYSLIPGGR